MGHVFIAVLPIFFLIVSGYFLRAKFLKDESFWAGAEKITYYFLLPCLLILEISSVKSSFTSASAAIGAAIASTLAVGAFAWASKYIFKIEGSLFTSIFQGSTRYNSYVFLGMATAVYGSEGTALMGLFTVYMIVITNVLSIVVMNHYGIGEKKSLKNVMQKTVTNPLIISAVIGVALNLWGIGLPDILRGYMRIAGGAASPLSLMAVGAGLNLKISKEKMLAVTYSTSLKLIILPVITLMILRFFDVTGFSANMAILYSSLPCAGNAYILSRQMGGDSEAMASIVTVTILTSMLTVSFFVGQFG